MTDNEKIELVRRLCNAVEDSTNAFNRRCGGSKTAVSREWKAVKKVLTVLLGRTPTENEINIAYGN